MKIRCVENSIRYRLRKSDIADLRKDGITSNQVGFGAGSIFKFSLGIGSGDHIEATFNEGEIEIQLPRGLFQEWADSSAVSIEEKLPMDGGSILHLLIEKDFPCKDREEDISDTFFELNPNENC